MDRQSKIRKVRALYALARNKAATEGETNAAMEQAHRLMDRYDINQDEINTVVEEYGPMGSTHVGKLSRKWKQYVWDAAARLNYCSFYVSSQEGFVTGREIHQEATELMAEYLVEAVQRARDAEPDLRGTTARDSFCFGAARNISIRATELVDASQRKTEQANVQPGTALVPVTNLYTIANRDLKAYYAERGTTFRRGTSKSIHDHYAVERGYKAGQKVSLSPQATSQTTQALGA